VSELEPSAHAPESQDDDALDARGGGQRFLDWIWETLRTWGPALLAVLLVRSVLAEPFRIPSGSMVPTLEVGDHILVTKYSYGFRIPLTRIPIGTLATPARGDIVVFVYPGSEANSLQHYLDLPFPPAATYDYVKRVVGLPGDTIEVKNGDLYVNAQLEPRKYVDDYPFVDDRCKVNPTLRYTETLDGKPHAVLADATPFRRMGDYGPITVPDGNVFAMGDNRDHSSDSRIWGFVPLRNIKGKAQFVWLSYDRCQNQIPIFGDFRSQRFGTNLYGDRAYTQIDDELPPTQ
jgi:signal peptidase I